MSIFRKIKRLFFSGNPSTAEAKGRGKATMKARVYRASTGKWEDVGPINVTVKKAG